MVFYFFRCGCDECMTSRSEDSLRHSRSRINAYRALASPSLIALSSKDPILTAFELSWELRRLSFAEHEFKSEYLVSAFCRSKTIKSSFSPKRVELCNILTQKMHLGTVQSPFSDTFGLRKAVTKSHNVTKSNDFM